MVLMRKQSHIIIDPSALLAVFLNEQGRNELEQKSSGHHLAAPGCIQWEVGNALYGAFKRNRIRLEEAQRVFEEFKSLSLRIMDVDINSALEIAMIKRIPAYDAYYLQCATQHGCPLLTLDQRMIDIAEDMGVMVL